MDLRKYLLCLILLNRFYPDQQLNPVTFYMNHSPNIRPIILAPAVVFHPLPPPVLGGSTHWSLFPNAGAVPSGKPFFSLTPSITLIPI